MSKPLKYASLLAAALASHLSGCAEPPASLACGDGPACSAEQCCLDGACAACPDAGVDAPVDPRADAGPDAGPCTGPDCPPAMCDGVPCPPDCDPATCPDDANPCTEPTCDESGQCALSPVAAGTVCRPSSGACDLGETCDGTGAQCPADLYDGDCDCPVDGPIAGYAEHDGVRAIDPAHFVLVDGNGWTAAAAHFDALALPYAALETLPLNRTANAPAGALKTALAGMIAYSGGFEWESGDQTVTYWVPQGLTGGAAGARQLVAVSWHYKEESIADDPNPPEEGTDKGIRLSFADVTTVGGNIPYRHVLLVQPDATTGFKSVNIHAGGLAWEGPYLYVADTSRGVRVFDLTRLLQVSTAPECASRIGKNGAEYCAYGYAYALPQVGSFAFPAGLSAACRPKFSFLSLDATSVPPSLLSGEYENDPATGIYGRLLRWPLDPMSHKLATGEGAAVRASGAWYAGNRNLQGATAINGKFFLDATRYNGALSTGAENQPSKVYKAAGGDWAWMSEGIHRTPAGLLWIVTEGHPNMPRLVFSAKASQIP